MQTRTGIQGVYAKIIISLGYPGGSVVKNPPANAGDTGLIPGLGRSPSKGNCNPLQYSCLENPMDRMDWQATVHGVVKELDMPATEQQQYRHDKIMSEFFFCLCPIARLAGS